MDLWSQLKLDFEDGDNDGINFITEVGDIEVAYLIIDLLALLKYDNPPKE